MSAFKAITGASLAVAVAGFRVPEQSQTKVLGKVPIYNYNLRHLQSAGVAETSSTDYDWVVVFEEGRSDEQLANFCGEACRVSGHPSGGGVPFVTMHGSEEKLQKMLAASPAGVKFAEPDLPVYAIPEIPVQGASVDHWGLDRMNLAQRSSTGKGVHIYVMDTGTRVSHSDFGGRAIATLDTLLEDGNPVECQNSNDPNCGLDDRGHGTHTAGSAGGAKYGVAPESIIHGMRVCCGLGTNTLAGFDWILRKAERPALVTMSLGMHPIVGQVMSKKVAVDKLVEAGIAVFVSSGNDDMDTCAKTFGFIESSITVGASDEEDNRAWFSNYGPCLDIYAPGTRIPSLSHLDDTSEVLMSGTSMATPLVAGAGALLLERDPGMSPAKMKSQLISMATKDALSDMMAGDPNLLVNVR